MSTRLPAHPFTTATPTNHVSNWYLTALGLAQFGIYVAILSPVYVSMQLKAQALNPDDPASVIAVALPLGSLGAIFGNPLFGALSDRTRTRWGRRRPWLLAGILVLLGGLAMVASSPNVGMLTVAWIVCQLGSNAAYSAMMASWADNVPELQRGRASSVIGLAQNLAVLAGTYAAVLLVENLPLLFILPGVLGVLCVLVYAFVTPDRIPEVRPKPFSWLTIVQTFWTNPITHRDYGLAWWSRFLIILATFLFTTFRLFYMQDHLGMTAQRATSAVAFGVLLYTIALMIGTAFSGWLSDRLRRRKVFVGGSTLLFGVGLVVLVYAQDVTVFYVAEVIMGFAYGIYVAVDNALVVDVLPDKDKPGKDLGVMNIANSLPQSFAPALGALLLGVGAGDNYPVLLWGAGIVALVGALVVIPIRSVR
ncbi:MULTISPECIES: MFS transporter [unclassified Curtobacterium]|uniref:MFS transporter n=1 Tax=unclassified Curtobacterium TaxID=257496 RepID=UPI000DA88519|nr:MULTISPECIES: MFS transporter [unclassified Curtobacterium]QSB24340.1 MFS transporter [Curtobacterium sp. 24E2]QZQ56303.1 MFS transporter [Curtobacterium sp. TC1]WIE72967.1 MFS transporter [Curtobacterium sp. MCJR17_020]